MNSRLERHEVPLRGLSAFQGWPPFRCDSREGRRWEVMPSELASPCGARSVPSWERGSAFAGRAAAEAAGPPISFVRGGDERIQVGHRGHLCRPFRARGTMRRRFPGLAPGALLWRPFGDLGAGVHQGYLCQFYGLVPVGSGLKSALRQGAEPVSRSGSREAD
jgi:hypothetical protein